MSSRRTLKKPLKILNNLSKMITPQKIKIDPKISRYLDTFFTVVETPVSLDTCEKDVLKKYTQILTPIFEEFNETFNEQAFEDTVKMFYRRKISGGEDDEIILSENDQIQSYTPPKKGLNIYDFYAIVGFIVSIYLLYLIAKEVNDLSCIFTGKNIDLVGLGKDSIQLVKDIAKVHKREMTSLELVYKLMSNTFGEHYLTQLKNLTHKIITQQVPDYSEKIASTCYTQTKGVFGILEGITKTYLSENPLKCAFDTKSLLEENFIAGLQLDKKLLENKIFYKIESIRYLFGYAKYLSVASIGYIGKRFVLNDKEPLLRLTEEGTLYGGRKNKTYKKSNL